LQEIFLSINLFFEKFMLNEKIGINAGLIWKALESGEQNVKAVKKATKLTEKDLNLALGWLAREGKLKFNEAEGEVYVSLV
jgi:hypothetical protein